MLFCFASPLIGKALGLADIIPVELMGKFGGRIELTEYETCLWKIPFFPFVYPVFFRYIEVGDPMPARLYALHWYSTPPGIVNLVGVVVDEYLNFNLDQEGVWTLGIYVPGGVKSYTDQCWNGAELPDADGFIKPVGTSN